MSNSNYFLAISVRIMLPVRRYFVGVVTCAKDRIMYDMRVAEKRELLNEYKLSPATVSKMGILAFPNKDGVKAYHKALKKYFEGADALLAWIVQKLEKRRDELGLPRDFARRIDFKNIIIGKIGDGNGCQRH